MYINIYIYIYLISTIGSIVNIVRVDGPPCVFFSHLFIYLHIYKIHSELNKKSTNQP